MCASGGVDLNRNEMILDVIMTLLRSDCGDMWKVRKCIPPKV